MWPLAQDGWQQIPEGVAVPCPKQLVPKHLVDARRHRVGAHPTVPTAQLIQRAPLEPPGRRQVLYEQTGDVPSRQADFIRLQRTKVNSRMALLAFEHLSDAPIAGRIDELASEEVRALARDVVVSVRPQPVGRIERARQIVEAE